VIVLLADQKNIKMKKMLTTKGHGEKATRTTIIINKQQERFP